MKHQYELTAEDVQGMFDQLLGLGERKTEDLKKELEEGLKREFIDHVKNDQLMSELKRRGVTRGEMFQEFGLGTGDEDEAKKAAEKMFRQGQGGKG